MTKLKWLSNIPDPKDPSSQYLVLLGETHRQARDNIELWIADKVIGEPKATENYSQEQIRSFGYVGVYAYVEETKDDRRQQFNDFISGKTNHLGEI